MEDELHKLDIEVGKAFGFKPRISWEILNEDEDASMIGFEREAEARKWWDEHPSIQQDRHIGTWEIWPLFSTDIAAAFQVVEKLYSADWSIDIYRSVVVDDDWMARFSSVNGLSVTNCEVFARTLPEAICRAALKTVTNTDVPALSSTQQVR